MTVFGPDISSYEQGLNVAALAEPFVMMKCTEGTYYADPDYADWLGQARSAGKLPVAYHFVKAEESASAQASWLAAHIRDRSVPVMLDVETEGASAPHLPLVLDLIDAMTSQDLNVRLVYLPRWFWQDIGSPSLTPLAQRGVGVVASAYPGRRGLSAPVSYADSGGDTGPGWAPYGGVTPALWQFTDAGVEQQSMDFNAYRGTIDQLAVLLGHGPVTPGGDVELSDTVTISPGFANRYPATAPDGFTPNAAVSVAVLLEGAAIRAVNNEHLLGDLSGKLDQLLNRPQQTVDVGVLASQIVSAISGHLTATVDVQAVAVAVQQQLAQALGSHGAG